MMTTLFRRRCHGVTVCWTSCFQCIAAAKLEKQVGRRSDVIIDWTCPHVCIILATAFGGTLLLARDIPTYSHTIWWLYFWMRWKLEEEITILADDWDDT